MISGIISPSKLAAIAGNFTPLGKPAEQDGTCAMCGYAHEAGDLVAEFSPGDSFTDFTSLRGNQSNLSCGWCLATSADFTQKYAKTVVCSDGVFPAASNDHIAYWLLNPPKGSWVFINPDQKKQHLIWRAPVNTSDKIFQIRFGDLVLSIRHDMLIKGAEAARRLAEYLSIGRKGAALKSPFIGLSRYIDNPAHGTLRRELYSTENPPDVMNDIDLIHRLSPGEIWGLTAVLYAKNIARPDPNIVFLKNN